MSGQVIEYKPTIKCDYCGKVKDECELVTYTWPIDALWFRW